MILVFSQYVDNDLTQKIIVSQTNKKITWNLEVSISKKRIVLSSSGTHVVSYDTDASTKLKIPPQ